MEIIAECIRLTFYAHRTVPLKQEASVRKSGGLFMSPNGVKVEVPPGASTGRRERIICAPVPSTARGLLGPWLGPNLRMASDIQLFYSPQNFRQPVAIFIPFSYAAARELAYPLEDDSSQVEKDSPKGMQQKEIQIFASLSDSFKEQLLPSPTLVANLREIFA
ncbi:hypothetical protein AHF37_11559 [Paragonimus kellicotti]|nr:hypothetical protein AHF37_11559 [Paragonimus kellicotti]